MDSNVIPLVAKKSHYAVDGTGRDTYINFDNGGNYRGYLQEGIGKFSLGSFHLQPKNRTKSYGETYAKPIHYIGDGTGRDIYIGHNEGGISKGVNKKQNFLSSLRAPIHRNQISKQDVYMQSQTKWRPKGYSHMMMRQTQKNLDYKLSTFRVYQDPYVKTRKSFKQSLIK